MRPPAKSRGRAALLGRAASVPVRPATARELISIGARTLLVVAVCNAIVVGLLVVLGAGLDGGLIATYVILTATPAVAAVWDRHRHPEP